MTSAVRDLADMRAYDAVAVRRVGANHVVRRPGTGRWIVVLTAMLVPKLIIAASTYGTQDIKTFSGYLASVQRVGPIEIYSATSGTTTDR